MSLPNRPRFKKPTTASEGAGAPVAEPKFRHPDVVGVEREPTLAVQGAQAEEATAVAPPTPVETPVKKSSRAEQSADDFIALDFSTVKHHAPKGTPLYEDGEDRFEEEPEKETRSLEQIIKESFPEDVRASVKRMFSYLYDDVTSEVTINGPRQFGFKQRGQRAMDPQIDFHDANMYHSVINQCLLPFVSTRARLSPNSYLVEGQLTLEDPEDPSAPPLIARVHIIAPPAVRTAKITIAKKARKKYRVDDFVAKGTLTSDMAALLKALAKGRATMVFSGVSGSGKTTMLEALSREFDPSDRVILIEDTPELSIPVSDLVVLKSQQAKPTDDPSRLVTLEWLVRQANRMRPDRIIVGEVGGAEMSEFLIAANSGADGSMTTIHASSPTEGISKILSLSLKAKSAKSELAALRDIASTVQIIVQLSLVDGKHVVEQIEEVSNVVSPQNLNIQTSTLWKYDRYRNVFTSPNRMSDRLQDFLRQRGVQPPVPSKPQRF